jgi:hypothetical protein
LNTAIIAKTAVEIVRILKTLSKPAWNSPKRYQFTKGQTKQASQECRAKLLILKTFKLIAYLS